MEDKEPGQFSNFAS